jgi:hypothetical protein
MQVGTEKRSLGRTKKRPSLSDPLGKDAGQVRVIEAPPSTSDAVPVTNDASSEAR